MDQKTVLDCVSRTSKEGGEKKKARWGKNLEKEVCFLKLIKNKEGIGEHGAVVDGGLGKKGDPKPGKCWRSGPGRVEKGGRRRKPVPKLVIVVRDS